MEPEYVVYRFAKGLRWLAMAAIVGMFLLFFIALLTLYVYAASGHSADGDHSVTILAFVTLVVFFVGYASAFLAFGHFGRAVDAFKFVDEANDTTATTPTPKPQSAS